MKGQVAEIEVAHGVMIWLDKWMLNGRKPEF